MLHLLPLSLSHRVSPSARLNASDNTSAFVFYWLFPEHKSTVRIKYSSALRIAALNPCPSRRKDGRSIVVKQPFNFDDIISGDHRNQFGRLDERKRDVKLELDVSHFSIQNTKGIDSTVRPEKLMDRFRRKHLPLLSTTRSVCPFRVLPTY